MKVLVINGSPKGKRSNTYRLVTAFLEGMGLFTAWFQKWYPAKVARGE